MDYEAGLDASEPPTEATLPPEPLDTEFKRRYPPDPLGKEMEDNARVWKVYRGEAIEHDKAQLDGWNSTLNVLLIFAALFSAVVTAFVAESYKLLQPDDVNYSASVLYALLVATNNSHALSLVSAPPNPAPIAASTTPAPSRWINGLWFTSLVLSLSVAFISILVMQWLSEYNARTLASAKNLRHWARRRAFYFQGLSTWHISGFISLLPVLLHAALFLFLGGLVLLLWDLDRMIALWLMGISCFIFVFYVATILAPLLRPDCPSATPLLRQLRRALTWSYVVGLSFCVAILSVDTRPAVLIRIALQYLHKGVEVSQRVALRTSSLKATTAEVQQALGRRSGAL
ncbi:hypothetical protein EXIGLDRAFT_313627 [Exidia glandulosa HHB12029]|uniref:DUF6535 domain-containing protein n=1 Tax=Exidia glandulosa HHB12029 TaxID=1314781 RepID=A0A165LU91_EXIGL|nr:hypothetical protein EXIGLDRAFT_313627 [Exidia glandulosa HHB12029]